MARVTQAQIKKLGTIIGKLESLQHEISNDDVNDRLASAKSELIRALRKAEGQ